MEDWILIPQANDNWVTYVFGMNFLLFVFIRWRFESQFFSFFRLIDTPLYFNNYSEKKLSNQGFVLSSLVFTVANFSLLLVFFLETYGSFKTHFSSFIIIMAGIMTLVVVRFLFMSFCSHILELHYFTTPYQFRNLTYSFRLSILLYICLIFYHYSLDHSTPFFNAVLIFLLLAYITVQTIVVKQLFKTINRGGLYFILYLCCLKLSPWIILFNGLKQLLV